MYNINTKHCKMMAGGWTRAFIVINNMSFTYSCQDNKHSKEISLGICSGKISPEI